MVFILGSSVTFEQFDGTAYSKDLVDTSSMPEAELHAIVTLLRQGSVSTVDVNGSKLCGASKVISAQSNLVDYERKVRSSQFMDGEDVNGGQLSSFTLPSQQPSCSMPWRHTLEKSWLQRHQDQGPSRSDELSSWSVPDFASSFCSSGDAARLRLQPAPLGMQPDFASSFCSSGDAALRRLQPAPLGMQPDFVCFTCAAQFLLHNSRFWVEKARRKRQNKNRF